MHLRLLLASGVVLLAFLGLAGAALEAAFKHSAKQALKDRLQARIYMLLTAADSDSAGRMVLSRALPEARFINPGSGLYAFVLDTEYHYLWHSASALGVTVPEPDGLRPGQSRLIHTAVNLFVLYYAVVWVHDDGSEQEYLFVVAEEAVAFQHQLGGFRRTLWLWLGGIAGLLIVAQVGVLGWSLSPLREIVRDLKTIEAGDKTCLDDHYPHELKGLAASLNGLLSSERAHLQRYRNTLGDLAHSLKTPLSILNGYIQDSRLTAEIQVAINEQLQRMDTIVQYQLQRAAARGATQLTASLSVTPVVSKIVASLDKVYATKQVRCTVNVPDHDKCALEEGDLYEICGNLLDNAYKWCSQCVNVNIEQVTGHQRQLYLKIEDDGPGIPASMLEDILKRGVRADEQTEGHGIGLAVVNELVGFYKGRLKAGVSSLGGVQWEVWLPTRKSPAGV